MSNNRAESDAQLTNAAMGVARAVAVAAPKPPSPPFWAEPRTKMGVRRGLAFVAWVLLAMFTGRRFGPARYSLMNPPRGYDHDEWAEKRSTFLK